MTKAKPKPKPTITVAGVKFTAEQVKSAVVEIDERMFYIAWLITRDIEKLSDKLDAIIRKLDE